MPNLTWTIYNSQYSESNLSIWNFKPLVCHCWMIFLFHQWFENGSNLEEQRKLRLCFPEKQNYMESRNEWKIIMGKVLGDLGGLDTLITSNKCVWFSRSDPPLVEVSTPLLKNRIGILIQETEELQFKSPNQEICQTITKQSAFHQTRTDEKNYPKLEYAFKISVENYNKTWNIGLSLVYRAKT